MSPVAEAAMAPAGWIALPELAPGDQLLVSHGALLLRLFHALGGQAAWFRLHVWPLMRAWEAHTAGLPWLGRAAEVPSPAAPLRSEAEACDPEPRGSLLERVLEGICALAERHARLPIARSPEGLRLIHRHALEESWRYLQETALMAPGGRAWRPGMVTVRAWREASPGPQFMQRIPITDMRDPWIGAAQALVARGLWSLDGPTGRWLGQGADWGLLWPLAAHDLARERAAVGARGLDPAGVALGLRHWDHLAEAGDHPVDWRRDDGRVLRRLRVRESFRHACGLQ